MIHSIKIKNIINVAKTATFKSIADRKNIVLIIIIGFILDSGVNTFVQNARTVGQPLNLFESFIMCTNHWYFIVLLMMGLVFEFSNLPRLDEHQVLLIYRTGKVNWYIGEVLQICIYSVSYVLILLAGTIACSAGYSFTANQWSLFTVNYRYEYAELLSNDYRHIDEQVYRYFYPNQALLHGFALLCLCLITMGMVMLLFSIIKKKIIGILLNVFMIVFVILFDQYRSLIMWISPFCHAMLKMHNTFVFKQLSVPLGWSYLYYFVVMLLLSIVSVKMLKKKWF